MSRRNPAMSAVITELQAAGLSYEVSGGGERHYKIRTQINGRKQCFVVGTTASDRKAALNNRAQVRRALRKEGMM
jgi:predicted aspartyl protease